MFAIDAVNLWPLLSGANLSAPRDHVVLGHEFVLEGVRAGALIQGDWKLIVGAQPYSDYRGPLYPCTPPAAAANCAPHCLFNLKVRRWSTLNLFVFAGPANACSIVLSITEYHITQPSVPTHTEQDDPWEHRNLVNVSGAAEPYRRLLALYDQQVNLFQDNSTDTQGFNDAVQHKYRGYMGQPHMYCSVVVLPHRRAPPSFAGNRRC